MCLFCMCICVCVCVVCVCMCVCLCQSPPGRELSRPCPHEVFFEKDIEQGVYDPSLSCNEKTLGGSRISLYKCDNRSN